MQGSYDVSLIILSIIVSVFASFTALGLAQRLAQSTGTVRYAWLGAAAIAMGGGIWAMHFVAILAFSLPVPITYDLTLTLLSLAVAIIFTALGIHLAFRRGVGAINLLFAGTLMGLGVVSMHYIGMAAMQMAAIVTYNWFFVALSIAIAIAASMAALWLSFKLNSILGKIAGAVCMGTAVCGMHYTGMYAATCSPAASSPVTRFSGIDPAWLAGGIAAVTIIVLFLGLVLALVDQHLEGRATVAAERLRHINAELEMRVDERTAALTRINQALQTSEARFRRVVEAAPNAIVTINEAGLIEMVNAQAEMLFGYRREELLGQAVEILVPERFRSHHPEQRQSFFRDPQSRAMGAGRDLFGVKKDGTEFPVEIGLNPIETDDGTLVLSAIVDISERRAAEAALRKGAEDFRYLFQSNPLPMWVYESGSLKFLKVNKAAVLNYGYSRDEFLAMRLTDIRPPEDIRKLMENLESATGDYQKTHNWRHRRKNGDIIRVDIFSHALIFEGKDARLTVALDVTQRNVAEEQLRQAQKMDAIGQLTGGVAHDFNNLLAVIQGNLESIGDRVRVDPATSELVEDALKATEHGASLTHQLLAYSRQQPLEPRVLDLDKVISEMATMLRRTLEESIKVDAVIALDMWKVRIDPHQLQNALLNLAVNARDAMPNGGELTIEGSNVTLDDHYVANNADVAAGRYALISVSDTGAGMPPEVINRAFEPFFTTKAVGHGTGLGLSMVYGFVKQSGGHIKIYSEVGLGTTIKLYLPSAETAGSATEELETKTAAPRSAGGEVIMVVEDDPSVRKLTVRLLAELGYVTIEAQDGASALRALAEVPRIDLFFTDVVLPGGMNGAILARKAKALRPDLKILYMSGYTRNAVLHNGELDTGVQLLTKPFRRVDLALKIRQILSNA